MPQVQLPLFPSGTTRINEVLAYARRGDQVVYYSGHLTVFTRRTDDLGSFRLFTTPQNLHLTLQESPDFLADCEAKVRLRQECADSGLDCRNIPAGQ